jgi:putative hydrolase of the HAD superfamily
MIRAVLWDVDDTIFDYTSADRTGLLRHLEAEGQPPDAALERWHEVGMPHYRRFLLGETTIEEYRRARARDFLDRILTDFEADAWFERYTGHFEAAWSVFPDVVPALDALPYRHGLLSNSSTAHQDRKLRLLGVRSRFEALVCSYELGFAKPDPRAFLAACEALDVPPAEAVYVGDNLRVDGCGARDAGLHGVWVDRVGHPVDLPERVHRITSLAELPTLLTALA